MALRQQVDDYPVRQHYSPETPNHLTFFFFALALQPNAGHGLLIPKVSRSHTMTQQSVGLLWTSDQLVAETST